ncbi:hypothetical protein DXG01_008869 [Tephrocybe rancida]|nr:hypothetical protein DXG01_008869 [Tephrocybe rancida]
MSFALDVLIFVTAWAHVILAPYTKVEESFNLHATHDVLSYGISPSGIRNYDHNTFPGAVPRTFIGSVILAWLATPAILLGPVLQKSDVQMIIRICLATGNALGLCFIRRAVSRRFGHLTSVYFTLLSITQFHLPFWMGRTLPNMFALLPALASLITRTPYASVSSGRSTTKAIAFLTFATVVFRAEILLLLGPIVLQSMLFGHITLKKVIKVGLVSGLISLALTMTIDSYFWGKPYLWPEFAGIYFNVYQGKSAEWGTSPRYAYWTSHLPKLLLSSLPLSMVGFLRDQSIRVLLLPFLLFIGLISCLAHKEWRFIIYVVPIFNASAAVGARYLTRISNRTTLGKLFALSIMPIFLGLNIALTCILTLTSINNYPGGDALALMHNLYPQYPSAQVHISNLAAQTGASLFLQLNAPPYPNPIPDASLRASSSWTYDKTENLTIMDLTAQQYITHLIVEEYPDEETRRHWEVVATVESFERWSIDWHVLRTLPREKSVAGLQDWLLGVLKMVKEEKLWILHRKS